MALPDEFDPIATVRRLSELVRRVYSSTDTDDLLEEIVTGVVEGLGYGVAAIARLEGETLVMTHVAGPEDVRRQILGRRTPAAKVLDEYRQADRWGILRYVPAGRMTMDRLEAAWIPDIEPIDDPNAWHPEDALYAPLYSVTGDLLGNMAVDLPPGAVIPGAWDRELLQMFVVQASLALSAAAERDRLTEQLRLGEMLKEVALAGHSGGFEEILQAAAIAIATSMDTEQVWMRCFPERDRGPQQVASHPRPMRQEDDIATLRREFSTPSTVQPVLVGVHDDDSAVLPESMEMIQSAMRHVDADRAVVCPVSAGGELLGYILLAFSLSRPRLSRAEQEAIREVGRELGRMVQQARILETEQRLVEELRALARYRSELIATISHELKTPLTAIMGHAELMEDRCPEEESLDAILRNTKRLNRLVDNLLTYSRVQGRRDADRRPVDLDELCRASVELLEIRASQAGVDIAYVPSAGRAISFGDPEEIGRVIDNMIDNAVKYSRPGGAVTVRILTTDDEAAVEVRDTGIGISEFDLGHLFSPFHRSTDPNALSVPGTGLGLAIAQRIAHAHGGRLDVDSRLGVGSTFCFSLPLRSS